MIGSETMPKYLKGIIEDIRLIPMEDDSETIEQHQEEYFENRLPFVANYRYEYYKSGMLGNQNDLLLFQYQNHIIASGLLDKVISYNIENAVEILGHSGVFIIQKGTLKTFKPISLDELKKYATNIDKFGQSKTKLNISDLDSFLDRLEVLRIRKQSSCSTIL